MKNIFARSTLIAGIIFIIIAVMQLFAMNSPLGLLWLVGYIAVAVALLAKRRDLTFAAGGGILTLMALVDTIQILGYSGMYTLIGLVHALAFAALTVAALAGTTNYLDQYKDTILKLWFLPTALRGLELLLQLMFYATNHYGYYFISIPSVLLGGLIAVAGFLFASVWLLFPEKLPEVEKTAREAAAEMNGYIGMVKHILLLLFTFGIWQLIWIYRTTKYLNRIEADPIRKPVTELLLCMFIPFYTIFWNYKSALRVDTLLKEKEMGPSITNVCIFWSIFVGFIVPILMQDSINRIALSETDEDMFVPELVEMPEEQEAPV